MKNITKEDKSTALHYMTTLSDVAMESFLILNSDLRVLFANPTFYEVFKVTPKQTENFSLYKLGNGQWDIPKLKELLEEILPQKKIVKDYEVTHDFAEIGKKTMMLNARQIDAVQLIVLAIGDVTERKKIQDELAESESKFKLLFESAPEGIIIADAKSKKFLMVNKATCRMLGYNNEELKNLGVADIHPEKDLPYVFDQFERQAKGEFTLSRDMPIKRKNGSVFYADVNATADEIAGKKYLIGFFHDTTERKFIEQKLSEQTKILEKEVVRQTAELTKKIEELEKVNKTMVGRELKMVELKKEIEKLKKHA